MSVQKTPEHGDLENITRLKKLNHKLMVASLLHRHRNQNYKCKLCFCAVLICDHQKFVQTVFL